MSTALPRLRAMHWAAAPLSGLASALGFAPFDLWPITLLACTVLIGYIARAERLRRAFVLGWMFGVGQFVLGLEWIPAAFTHQAKMPIWYGGVAVVLLSMYLALYPAVACGVAWWLGRRTRLSLVLYLAAVWMLSEWLRGMVFTGFPWNPLGAIWLPLTPVAQSASWIGAYGLSGLAILAGGAGWLTFTRDWRAAAVLLLLPVTLTIMSHVGSSKLDAQSGPGVVIRIVQPNIPQDERGNPEDERRNEHTYAALSGTPGPRPRLLLWPEGAANSYLQFDGKARVALAQLLRPNDVLLIGGDSAFLDRNDELIYRNSVFALGEQGKVLWRYDKAHLVPFGEYLPWRPVLSRIGLSQLVAGDGDFTNGPGPRSFELPDFGAVGVQICFEIIFSGHVVDPSDRPAFIFNPSNDAWFGRLGPPQHLAQARLRAIEEGLPVVRATVNGISALIDARGVVVASIPHEQAGVLDATVPRALESTLFARFGLWTSGAFGVLLSLLGFVVPRSRRRGTNARSSALIATDVGRPQ